MTHRTLGQIQAVLASAGILLVSGSAFWSWRAGDRHGVTLALLIVAIALASIVLTRVVTRSHRDHVA